MADIFDNYSPDSATKAKISIVAYYFGIYFRIINPVLAKSKVRFSNSRIVYIDLFAGKGIFDDKTESIPIKLLRLVKKMGIDDIIFYFNDNRHIDSLKKNISQDPEISSLVSKCYFTNHDSKYYDIKKIIGKNDIVLSFIDPSGYLRVDPETIGLLTKNYFSDCLFFLNVQNFFMRIDVDNERSNMIKLFGSEEKLEDVITIIRGDSSRKEKEIQLIKKILSSVSAGSKHKLYFLPFFLRCSTTETSIYGVIFLTSKYRDGLIKLKNSIKIEDFLKNEYGRFIGSIDPLKDQLSFDDQLFEKNYDEIIKLIPNLEYINRKELISKVDEVYTTNFGHISAYNDKDMNVILNSFFEKNQISIEGKVRYNAESCINFGDKTKFRREK